MKPASSRTFRRRPVDQALPVMSTGRKPLKSRPGQTPGLFYIPDSALGCAAGQRRALSPAKQTKGSTVCLPCENLFAGVPEAAIIPVCLWQFINRCPFPLKDFLDNHLGNPVAPFYPERFFPQVHHDYFNLTTIV